MEQRKYYRTIVLSDIHLGTAHSKTDEVCHFLSNVDCDRLILNGDIIDGWHLKKSGTRKWQPNHTRFFKILMRMMERKNTQVVYVRGNHDDFLDGLAPLNFYNISIVRDYEIESAGRRYFVTHGDIFDRVTTQMKWLALLGDMGYTFLLSFNSLYNRSLLPSLPAHESTTGLYAGIFIIPIIRITKTSTTLTREIGLKPCRLLQKMRMEIGVWCIIPT